MFENYYLISCIIIILSFIPFMVMLERRKPHAREIMLVAVLVTITVLSRAVFFMIPFFKPILAFVIISGIGLGARTGLLVGTLSAFISNFMFGQGPWTVWQMLALGLCGFLAGLIFSRRYDEGKLHTVLVCIFGFIAAVVVYGGIMDTYTALLYMGNMTKQSFFAIYLSGLPVNLILGICTVLCLALFTKSMARKLRRVKYKYNM